MLQQNLFAGFGGQGMLLIGQFLAQAGMTEGKYVSWLPSYGPEMRGGTANCSVCVSDKPIASPVLPRATCVVAMNRPSLDKFEGMVRPGLSDHQQQPSTPGPSGTTSTSSTLRQRAGGEGGQTSGGQRYHSRPPSGADDVRSMDAVLEAIALMWARKKPPGGDQ